MCSFRYSLGLSLYSLSRFCFFFFNDTATTEIYTLSLHDALPISHRRDPSAALHPAWTKRSARPRLRVGAHPRRPQDRKSTRLNSSHVRTSYAVFCLKKKSRILPNTRRSPSTPTPA